MASLSDLAYASMAAQARLLRAREISPVALLDAYLARIERYDGALLTSMEAIERELGMQMDQTEPVPPVYPQEIFK